MNGSVVLEVLAQVVTNPIVVGGAAVLALTIVGLWVLGVTWAFRDMAHRSDRIWARYAAATWVLLSGPILLPVSLAVVALVRPAERSGDRRLERLVAAVRSRAARPACPSCGEAVVDTWVRCPACADWLARSCPRCERPAPLDADLCPWCAWSDDLTPVTAPEPTAIPVWRPAADLGAAAMAGMAVAARASVEGLTGTLAGTPAAAGRPTARGAGSRRGHEGEPMTVGATN